MSKYGVRSSWTGIRNCLTYSIRDLNLHDARLYIYIYIFKPTDVSLKISGFGNLEVAFWPLVPKFEGSHPAEAVGIFRAKRKNPQHVFLRRGSKAVGPM